MAVVVAAFVSLLGSVVGVVWHAVAPTASLFAIAHGSEQAMKPFIGDDVWLGALGVIAGLLCVLVLVVSAPDASGGPGAQVGLAVGGLLGMLIAARVGHLIGHPHVNNTIHTIYRGVDAAGIQRLVTLLDFKVRAVGVLVTWPMTSVFLGTVVTWVRAIKQPTPAASPSYPGSS